MERWTLTLHAYCGMAVPYDDCECEGDARDQAAKLLRQRRRQGYPVTTLKPGREWEIEEQDCLLVPDECGVLVLRGPGERVPL